MSDYIVTVKLPHNPNHNPRDKKTGTCPFSEYCTDSTGEHHSTLVLRTTEEQIRHLLPGMHITRIEKIED